MITLSTCCRTLYSKSYMRNKLMYQRALPLMYQKNEAAIYTNTWIVRITTSCNIRSSNNKFISSTRNTRANTSKGKDGNVSPHSFTVFSAGAAKKRSAMAQNKVEEQAHMDFVDSKTKLVIPSVPLGHKEWSKLKEEHGTIRGFEDFVMSKMVSTQSDINVAKSLLNFAAKENNGISYKLLLKYLALCGKLNLVSEMYDVYDIMKSTFKSFDTGAYSLFIKGFSQTDRWRESIDMLETITKTIIPSPRNYGDCIQGAIHHRRGDIAWGLYQEMLQHDLTPCEDTFQCLFKADRDMQDEAFRNELRCVLDYLRDHQIYPGESLMQSIKFWFESNPNENWRGHLSRISDSGRCEVCRQQLESIHLTPEEYKTLKDSVLDSVIKGRDTFRKTTPQELQEFQQFVRSRPPYDIVIDGLNVAHMSLKEVRSQTLLHVVTSLSSGGKRALVLGRKHMLKESRAWVRRHMQQLQQQADCFFLDDISEDDPFLLYASLSSGSHCCFLTRDLLRDHKACLPDAHTKRLFFKWQRGHQLVLPFYTPGKKVHLQPILSYDTILQSTDLSWHIPYDKIGVERASYEVPKTWLCLQRSH
ncbi:mitochondrial ribonuclease P catalytic subunit [Discoglossus pictus]